MNEITYQEIDIKLNVIFLQRQIRSGTSVLDAEIKEFLRRDFNPHTPEPMEATEVESAMDNAHIRITTSVDWTMNEPQISQYIMNKVVKMFPWGVAKIELISIREEAEIYGNK